VGGVNVEGVALGEHCSVVSGRKVVEDESVEHDSLLDRDDVREVVLEVGEWRPVGGR